MVITVITCTGDRPEAFALCTKWMRRQTITVPVKWVIVDDGKDKIAAPEMPDNWTVGLHYQQPGKYGAESFIANTLRALSYVEGDKVIFVEDDDYYKPDYLADTARRLDTHDIVGQRKMIYFHLGQRMWRIRNNNIAPMSTTGIRWPRMEGMLRALCGFSYKTNCFTLDSMLWAHARHMAMDLYDDVVHVVGIKEMPGRGNLTQHQEWAVQHTMTQKDPNLAMLRALLGEDAKEYERWTT